MTQNTSDYEKVRTNLYDLLPEVYKSDVNKSVFENLFNRFLTKQETEKVAGYIGEGNANAIVKRQIIEPTLHRQAFQLQPIIYNKIGSVEHMASWYDILNELERLGVDIERLPIWGSVQEFNWAPPVDFDKVINYQDYYWYDVENPSSTPQYITIRSRCSTAVANANFWERLVEEFGLTIDIANLFSVDETLPSFDIESLNDVSQTVIVSGDATDWLIASNKFNITGTVSNNGIHTVITAPVFDSILNRTSFNVDGTLVAAEVTVGRVNVQRFDKIIVDGEYQRLMDPGFVFYIKDSGNEDLNNAFWRVAESDYMEDTNQTVIQIEGFVTDGTPNGTISNEEQLNFYLAERDCQCTGSIGWDLLQWDDNPEDPLWGGAFPGDHVTLLTAISNAGPPVGIGADGQLWFDTVADILFQYSADPLNTGWFAIYNNFSLIVEKTNGMAFWDLTPGCGEQSRIPAADQWIDQNKWFHETDVPNFSIAKQAQYPIIEYDWDLELNEWSYTDTKWQYRSEKTAEWVEIVDNPVIIELEPLTWWQEDPVNDEIVLDERYGDLTAFMVPGTILSAQNTDDFFTVEYSYFASENAGEPFNTRIGLTENIATSTLQTGDFVTRRTSRTGLQPNTTTQGDVFQDYGDQWMFIGYEATIPVPHQSDNPFVQIPQPSSPTLDPSTDFEYVQNYAVQEYSLLVDGVSDFYLSTAQLSGTLRPLTRRALVGFDDVRVYIDEIRQYGNYDEAGEDVVAVTGISSGTSTFTFDMGSDDINTFVTVGDTILIDGNVGGASGAYEVATIPTTNSVTVVEAIPVLADSNVGGTMANQTVPMDGISSPLTRYVRGIEFILGVNLSKFQVVRIEVGESSIEEFGTYKAAVRLDPDNMDFVANGFTNIGVIPSRRAEQVKSQITQYPLFDIYNIDGTPANRANPIFGFKTSEDYPVVAGVGLRIVRDADTGVTEFDQFILDEDDGKLYAYRDYSNEINDYWFNPATNELSFWNDFLWNDKAIMDRLYAQGAVSDLEPADFFKQFNGYYWYDTANDVLKRWSTGTLTWNILPNVDVLDHDVTLQTIWKKGLNNERYVPAKVDWDRRTIEEYTEQQDLFVEQRAQELRAADPSLSVPESEAEAYQDWLESQINVHSTTGEWVGAWEIPDPLYYNNQHENRKCLDSRELLTHFTTVIEAQPKIPGYNGPLDSMFHLIPTDQVNYGLGGTIKEYNDGFDTFLSSIFVNTVTPLRLIDFAHNQYEVLLNNLKEQYRKDSIDIFTNTGTAAILNLSELVTNTLILSHELNDNAAYLYGDSTTFTDNEGLLNDTGIRNWIATLPYIQTLFKEVPYKIVDPELGFVEISHHDGHRNQYALVQPLVENIINVVNNSPDDRTRFPGPTDPAIDTLGRTATTLPPNTADEFDAAFNTSVNNRSGTYWYTVQGADRVWYRLVVASAGPNEPAAGFADDTLWFDTSIGLEALRIKTTHPVTGVVTWPVVQGLSAGDGRFHNGTDPSDLTTATVSAYQVININEYLNDAVLEVEQRLYDNAPEPIQLKYNPLDLLAQDPVTFNDYLEQSFLDYTLSQNITNPYSSSAFDVSDPFTWNYKYSTPGAGIEILEASSAADYFIVPGDVRAVFDACQNAAICPSQFSFYIKNSGVNDGTWQTTSVGISYGTYYDAGNNQTVIFVNTPVVDSVAGVIYAGTLPSSVNTGAESGGDWRDYYEKLYGTPYPHLEPWKLQGYTEIPDWWNDAYLNDDPDRWGIRKWKYKHGFNIIGVDAAVDTFTIANDFREAFRNGITFSVDSSPGVHTGLYTVETIAPITSVNLGLPGIGNIQVAGDLTGTFIPGLGITINAGVGGLPQAGLTVTNSVFAAGTTTVQFAEPITDATDWDVVGGVTFNGTDTTINVVEDITSSVVEGRVAVPFGMWESIRTGVIPPGATYSNGVVSETGNPNLDVIDPPGLQVPNIPTYNYFSVNIDNVPVSADGGTTVYGPDQVFPPYWDHTGHFGPLPQPFDFTIRSVFFSFSSEIVAPGVDFAFNDSGTTEWEWRQTSQYLYDLLTVSFKMDPVRYVANTFGIDYDIVNTLYIDGRLCNTFSHTRTDFHGDVIGNTPYLVNGTNQWYVNYNRYSGFDTTWSDFRTMWVGWTAPMMYQFSSFVDTPSLSVAQRQIDISDFDHDVIAKRSPGVEDDWLDAFRVAITHIPPNIVRYDNQGEWEFNIITNLPVSRTINYYDVHNYQVYADPVTDILTFYKWDVAFADAFNDTFYVPGNQTHVFTAAREFTVEGSSFNDGTYTTLYSVYNAVDDRTIIELDSSEVAASIADGTITANYRSMPWETGQLVAMTTDETMPYPLETDNVNGLVYYYVIRIDDNSMRLALTSIDATTNTYIDIQTPGTRDQYVGEVKGTFTTDRSDTNWRRYAIDKSNQLSFATPEMLTGMQNLVDVIFGYESWTVDQGWAINADVTERDPLNGDAVNWTSEAIRFIDFAYLNRVKRDQVSERYEATVSEVTDVWTFTEPSSQLITGEPVQVFTSNNVFPTPIQRGLTYYMIRQSLTEFQLAATRLDAEQGNALDITSTAGVGTLWVTLPNNRNNSPEQEINPFRNAVWYKPNTGIVSNIITGPAEDVRTTQLIFDQYGRGIKFDDLHVLRLDKVTQVRYSDEVPNDVELTSVFQDPYNYLHMGGMHIFVDAYEHVLKYNNYTTEGQLLYDPFLGLNVTKFELLYNRQPEFTGRPNVGGYYLETFFNQGADLKQNIEAQTDELRYLYDTYRTIESQPMTAEGRRGLGYEGTRDYLDNLNLNQKSQFIFWRGMIQQKGSVNAVKAFVNSRRFIDAKVDDFWAIKIADFGSAYEKEYPEMWITTEDARSSDIRFQFVGEDDFCNPGYAVDVFDKEQCGYSFPDSGEPQLLVDDTFTAISLGDQDRWYNQPDQLVTLRNNGETLYFDMRPHDVALVVVTHDALPPDPLTPVGGYNAAIVYNTGTTGGEYYTFDFLNTTWVLQSWWGAGDDPIIRHNFQSDYLGVLFRGYSLGTNESVITIAGENTVTLANSYIPFTEMIEVFRDGVLLESIVDYTEVTDGASVFANELVFAVPFEPGEIVEVVFKGATLYEGTSAPAQYLPINSNIVKLNSSDLLDSTPGQLIAFTGYLLNKEAQNPARLMDKKSKVIVTNIQHWDPARTFHHQTSIHNVDLQRPTDPAIYSDSAIPTLLQYPPVTNSSEIFWNFWNNKEVGTSWMDDKDLDYFPYYDELVVPDLEDRLRFWGSLSEWGDLDVYEWVASDVPPSEYDALAAIEQGDTSIDESIRKTGVARKVVYNIGPQEDILSIDLVNNSFTVAGDQSAILEPFIGKKIGVTGFVPPAFAGAYTLVSYEVAGTTEIFVEETISDDTVNAGVDIIGLYVVAEKQIARLDCIVEGIAIVDGYEFTVTDIAAQGILVLFPTDVYVNGRLYEEGVILDTYTEYPVLGTELQDRVTFLQQVPEDPEEIQAGVDIGALLWETPYSVVTTINPLLQEVPEYYFWVQNKNIAAPDRNRTASIFQAQRSLITMPDPYVFFLSPVPEEKTVIDQVTETLPVRFTQSVIRGLRGLIDADRRYTIRWTRDFTLRDSLRFGKTPLDLKNNHEEWEIFRRAQQFNINRWQWDLLTEALIGYKIADNTIRVPSYERELYDSKYGTDTRFGIGAGQAFTDQSLSLQTVLSYLLDPDNDFYPTDINVFFDRENFGDPASIESAMDTIYNTFNFEHVNNIYFNCLLDAFSVQLEYVGIFKTSMIALHGIRPFQIAGVFDD